MEEKAKVTLLVGQFAENQVGGNSEVCEAAYDSLLTVGKTVVGLLAEIVADPNSAYRVTAIDLLECFHGVLDSSAAIPALRHLMAQSDPWLRLCAAEALWIIEGNSPRDIAADALAVIRETAELGRARVRDRAKRTLRTLVELGLCPTLG